MMVRRSIPLWIIIGFISRTVCGSALSDLEHHLLHNTTSLSEHHLASLISEGSAPSEHSQYLHIPDEYISNAGGLLNKHYPPSRPMIHAYRNPHFVDIESHQRRIASHYASEGKQDYRSPSYHDHQPMHSAPDYDITPLKKHDYGGNHNYGGGGGWDMFSGGLNLGSGFAGQAVKKGKEAKALFILMAPLILLAVFGPFLATQAMIPWITNGGLTSVSTIATGKRKKRSNYDPRQMAELEKRLQLFMEVQEFIAKTGSPDFAEEMGEAFLQCHKYSERRNKCLERIACEYTDETSAMDQAERRIAKMVLQNVMSNPMVSASIKGRLSKGSMFGKNHRGRCRSYWCEAIDRSKEKS